LHPGALQGKVYPKSVHGLCYFHLHVQGWTKFVVKTAPDTDAAKKCAETARLWIKSWFFDVESEDEYKFSRSRFNDWLSKQVEVLGQPCIDAIKVYIVKKLEPYEALWLNYTHLHVLGCNQHTMSIGEAMHWSMKSGTCGVRASMNADVAAGAMMDKAERKGQAKATKNAAQVNSAKLWTDSETSAHLTQYTEEFSVEHWSHSQKYKAFETAPGVWLVFLPGKNCVCVL
jgi:hypothetical protein